MKIPDDLLSAFVNGELDGAERQRIEQAIAHDRRIAQRVARHRALRGKLDSATFVFFASQGLAGPFADCRGRRD